MTFQKWYATDWSHEINFEPFWCWQPRFARCQTIYVRIKEWTVEKKIPVFSLCSDKIPVCSLCSQKLVLEQDVPIQLTGPAPLFYALSWVCTNCSAAFPIAIGTGGVIRRPEPLYENGVRMVKAWLRLYRFLTADKIQPIATAKARLRCTWLSFTLKSKEILSHKAAKE